MKSAATVITTFFLCFAAPQSSAESFPNPKLFFVISDGFDRAHCPEQPNVQDWYGEAWFSLSRFEEVWRRDSRLLFQELFSLIGKPFSRNELSVTLHLCKDKGSMSDPFLVAFWMFLNGPNQGTEGLPLPDYMFVDFVFHELLHHYSRDMLGIPAQSPLLSKYREETAMTRMHLHLMAIQAAVYGQLGRQDMLTGTRYLASLMPDYKRAWEIVDAVGTEAFLRELRGGTP